MMTPVPAVSVLLIADTLAAIRATLGVFRRQEGVDRLEVVVVAPRDAVARDAPELSGFGDVNVVEVDDVSVPAFARAIGVRAARAPVVVFAETHAFPRPGYVDALRRAHETGPWVVVGPSVDNGNPDGVVSWANLLLDYGSWVQPDRRGVVEDVPGHNAAYKRGALLQFGDELPERLRADSLMHAELRARGGELYLEPNACVDHVNVSSVRWAIVERFSSGRGFAGLRKRGWPTWRRAVYAAGAPLIPAVRMWRTLRHVRRVRPARERLPQLLPVLVVWTAVGAAGELVGYLLGPGSGSVLHEMELDRAPYVRASDRRALLEPLAST